jgi:hypothetical protein
MSRRDLSRIVDGTHIEIDVDLVGNVVCTRRRDHLHRFLPRSRPRQRPRPARQRLNRHLQPASPGSGTTVPEPATLALPAPALATTWAGPGALPPQELTPAPAHARRASSPRSAG